MKKLVVTVLIALVAFSAFAGISVTLDTVMQYSSLTVKDPQGEIKPGFSIGGAEADDESRGGNVLGELTATLSKSSVASAMVAIRFRTPITKYQGAPIGLDKKVATGAPVNIHGWDLTVKLFDGFKLSLGNTAYEVFAESIGWEPISGAGLFEQGANRFYIEYTPDFLSDLMIVGGMSMAEYGAKQNKPWKNTELALIYELPQTMKFAFEFHSVYSDLGGGEGTDDGEYSAYSVQADYIGTENFDILAGYSFVYDNINKQGVQHRIDLFCTYYAESFAVELYDAFLIRTNEDQTSGNRLGFKFSFYASEKYTPYVKLNWFKNYGYAASIGGYSWGNWQIERTASAQKGNLIVLDAGIGFTLSDNVYGSLGGLFKFNLTEGVDPENRAFWSIPLAITATF